MAATIAKKVTQYSVQLSTIDMPQIFLPHSLLRTILTRVYFDKMQALL